MLKQIFLVGGRLFPDRTVTLSTAADARQVTVPGSVQAAVAMALTLGVASSALVGIRSHLHDQAVAVAQRDAMTALQARLADAERATATARQVAETARGELADLAGPGADAASTEALAHRIGDHIAALEAELHSASREQQALQADRQRLASEKGKLQSTVGQLKDEQQKAQAKAEDTARVAAASAGERNRLKEKLADLERKLRKTSALEPPTNPLVQTVALPPQAETAPSGEDEEASTPKVALGAGFDLDGFLARYGIGKRHQAAVGGPFVALGSAKDPTAAQNPNAAAAVLRTVPLSAPLDSYKLESGFGVRVDPMNRRRSVHTGLDFSAPYLTPVHSTAPGEVVFAGWYAGYGKMVEIDHGNGFHTRYGHLNRLMVNVGEHIGKHATVGLLGSTGRSTGPHVHYEVLVDGVAQNPARFLTAGQSLGLAN